jgi:hypothetical protein
MCVCVCVCLSDAIHPTVSLLPQTNVTAVTHNLCFGLSNTTQAQFYGLTDLQVTDNTRSASLPRIIG